MALLLLFDVKAGGCMKKILIVEDSSDIREILQTCLQLFQYDIAALKDGGQIFERLYSYEPHLILMDIRLGEQNGLDICRAVKSSTKFCHIPVILMSGNEVSQEELDKSMADYFLAKPFDINTLQDQLLYYLHNGKVPH
ncbi:MAG: response regulator [Chitinophagaceae bacterium]|nr:response regulator [Chitinophagaceae bacterium]